MKKLLYLFLFVSIFSCESKKQTIITAEEIQLPVNNDKMLALGFVKAEIKDFSSDSGCGFLIVLEKEVQILNPLEKLELPFQKEGLKVWVKYRPIRPIAPECKKGIPVDLEDIRKS